MRATRWNGDPFNVSLESIAKPRLLTSEDVIVRLTSAGICGSDLHVYRGIAGSATAPWTLGHEGVGIVQEVGAAVQIVKPGDRVIVSAIPGEGRLEVHPMPSLHVYGFGPDFNGNTDGMQGMLMWDLCLSSYRVNLCLAEYIRVPQADESLIPIPHYPSRELDYLLISDIWPTAWQCLDASGFKAGETVAIFGAGPVGLLCAYSALFRGASRVYVVDHVKNRLAKAREIGAIPIDFTKGNAAKQILKFEKLGVNRSCDCCGYECVNDRLEPQENVIINGMIDVTIAGGGLGVAGVYMADHSAPGRPKADQISPTIDLNMTAFWLKSLSMKAIVGDPQALAPQLLELVKSGRAHPGCIVSNVIGIEEVPEGYKQFEKHRETKVVIRFPWQDEEWKVSNGDAIAEVEQNGHGSEKDNIRSLGDNEAEA
jgi:threonine dehydrogenase-like Zn-dependent dehydrogenase